MKGIESLNNIKNINTGGLVYKPKSYHSNTKPESINGINTDFKSELVETFTKSEPDKRFVNELNNSLKFTKHALERISSRGINLSEVEISSLNNAVCKAENKGIKDSVVMLNDTAFIVSIRNKTVITAIDKESFKEKVITNVDGVIIL